MSNYNPNNFIGDARGTASDVVSTYFENARIHVTANTADHHHRTLCDAPHTFHAGDVTGPRGMKANVSCGHVYPKQAADLRAFQRASTHLHHQTPSAAAAGADFPSDSPLNKCCHHPRLHVRFGTKYDHVALAKEMLKGGRLSQFM